MKTFIEKINNMLVDEATRYRVQFRLITGVFSVVSFGMTILNIITKNYSLGIATALFCILCLVDVLLERCIKNGLAVATWFFIVELVVLFTYFIVTGGVDNFSIIWLVLLPAIGISFFGMGKGSIVSAVVFIIMILCFYVSPFKDFSTVYNTTFRNRFPIIYVSAWILAMIMDYIRMISAREVQRLQKEYEHLSMHDALTDLRNRYGMNQMIEKLKPTDAVVAEAMVDLDFFKKVNDIYGHEAGDIMLKGLATVLRDSVPEDAEAFRWGGEEFVIIFTDGSKAREYCDKILENVRNTEFDLGKDKVHVTVSIGLALSDKPAKETDFAALLIKADDNLYRAKEAGRNCVIES